VTRATDRSISLYKEGIEAARIAALQDPSQTGVEATGWDLLGEALLATGNIEDAGVAEQKALALRRQFVPGDLGYSYWRLGALRLKEALTQQEKPREHSLSLAEGFTLQALQEPVGPPRYVLLYQQGSIFLEQGRVPQALLAMEAAVGQAQRWRVGIAPAFTLPDGSTAEFEVQAVDGFVEAAVNYGLRTHNQRWITESFQASELHRAINFEDSTQTAWRYALPLEYRETLGELQALKTKVLPNQVGTVLAINRLEMRLTEMEAHAGLGSLVINAENFPSHDSLSLFRVRLRDFEVLLSFGLGERESFIWAVTRNSLDVYRLPPAEQIRSTAREFRQTVEAGADVEDIAGRLYTMPFGQLREQEASKPAWLLSPVDGLLQLPFAALVPEHERKNGRMVFLAERHSLQVIAGALLPEGLARLPSNGFLAVGDPIYNVADPRWTAASPERERFRLWSRTSSTVASGSQLNRLPGSRREVESSAAAWGSGTATRVLEGVEASRENFIRSLAPAPQVIHLATHAFTPASDGEAYLAFGLGVNRQLEMLSASAVQTLQVPGSVVVMTGCATAPSDPKTGLGLAGLVHAWTVAGASAVVATEWAVNDNAGSALLSSFYRHLRNAPNNVPEALRLAQVEMIHSAGAHGDASQAAPASWAAYQVFNSHLASGRVKP
jgi:CHAT domain-containing protein